MANPPVLGDDHEEDPIESQVQEPSTSRRTRLSPEPTNTQLREEMETLRQTVFELVNNRGSRSRYSSPLSAASSVMPPITPNIEPAPITPNIEVTPPPAGGLDSQYVGNLYPRSRKRPKVEPPAKFDGTLSKTRDFVVKLGVLFSMRRDDYADDGEKIAHAFTLLEGQALKWARPIFEQPNHPLRNDLTKFLAEFRKVFGDRETRETSQAKLWDCKQKQSVSSYVAEFQALSVDLEFNEVALICHFVHSLKADIQDEFARIGTPSTLAECIGTATSLDKCLQACLKEAQRKNGSQSSKNAGQPRVKSLFERIGDSPGTNQTNASLSSRISDGASSLNARISSGSDKPKKAPRNGPVSAAERQRRKETNACYYCGDKNHLRADCPVRAQASAASAVSFEITESASHAQEN